VVFANGTSVYDQSVVKVTFDTRTKKCHLWLHSPASGAPAAHMWWVQGGGGGGCELYRVVVGVVFLPYMLVQVDDDWCCTAHTKN
jgi:hypothetical protein